MNRMTMLLIGLAAGVLLAVAVHGQRCPALCVVTFVFNPDVFDLLFYCEQFSQ